MTLSKLNNRVVEHAELVDIRVAKMSCESFATIIPVDELVLVSKVHGGSMRVESGLVTVLDVHVDARTDVPEPLDAEVDEDPIWRISVRMQCHWRFLGGFEPTDEECDAFSKIQGLLTAFPYVRQQVQSTSVDMGFPPAVLDLLRLARE